MTKSGVMKSTQEPLTQAQLGLLGEPGEFSGLGPTCHDRAPVFAVYEHATGSIALVCAACRNFVARIAVAKGGHVQPESASAEVH